MRLNASTAAALAGLALSAVAMAQNTGALLVDGNARYQLGASTAGTGPLNTSATITTGGPTVNFNHQGVGTGSWGHDHVFADWWWYRTDNDTREFAIANATSRTPSGTNSITYGYNLSGGLTGELTYTVTDTGASSGRIDQSWTITNPGSTNVNLSMFNFMDVFLGNADANDVINLTTPFERMLVTDNVIANLSMDWWGVGASRASAGGFSVVRAPLTNTVVDNLPNTTFPSGPADLAGAFQWELVVPAGGSVTILSSKALNDSAVPAPGALALLGLGGLLAARRRR